MGLLTKQNMLHLRIVLITGPRVAHSQFDLPRARKVYRRQACKS